VLSTGEALAIDACGPLWQATRYYEDHLTLFCPIY